MVNITETAITLDDSLDDLGIDSLDIVEIAMEIEDTFSLEFENHELESIRTVKQFVDMTESKRTNKN